MATNTLHPESVTATASAPQRHIDLEVIYAGIETAGTFIDALDSFICEVILFDGAMDAPESLTRHIGNIDTMARELKRVIGTAHHDLGEFISLAPAANLQVGERA